MSIQKFDSLGNNILYYINPDVLEPCVYAAKFIRYKKEDVKTRFKTTWVLVKPISIIDDNGTRPLFTTSNDLVEVCNKDCYRSLYEASETRKQYNENLSKKLEAAQARVRMIIDHLKSEMPSMDKVLEFILERADLCEDETIAVAERLAEFANIDISKFDIGRFIRDRYEEDY